MKKSKNTEKQSQFRNIVAWTVFIYNEFAMAYNYTNYDVKKRKGRN
jgi:hypothetical protein